MRGRRLWFGSPSDRQDEFVDGDRDSELDWLIDCEFVLAAAVFPRLPFEVFARSYLTFVTWCVAFFGGCAIVLSSGVLDVDALRTLGAVFLLLSVPALLLIWS